MEIVNDIQLFSLLVSLCIASSKYAIFRTCKQNESVFLTVRSPAGGRDRETVREEDRDVFEPQILQEAVLTQTQQKKFVVIHVHRQYCSHIGGPLPVYQCVFLTESTVAMSVDHCQCTSVCF